MGAKHPFTGCFSPACSGIERNDNIYKLRFIGAFFVYQFQPAKFTAVNLKPRSIYKDVYDQERYKATWSVNLFVLIAISLLTISSYVSDIKVMYYSAGLATILLTLNFGIITYLKKYKLPAVILSLIGMATLTYIILSQTNLFHFSNFAWMIAMVIFIFFTLGRKIGVIGLLYTLVIAYLFINFKLNIVLENINELSQNQLNNMIIAYSFAVMTIFYVINKFIVMYKHSENKMTLMNNELVKQNSVVKKKNNQNVLMLKEIHHRVKNNLQIVSSMLRLQAKDIDDEKLRSYFNDAVNRVSVMALVHEKMYQNNLEKIEPNEYFEELSKSISSALRSYCSTLEVKVQVEVEQIGLNTLVPLALIVNELLTNSIKYAFHDCVNPEVIIQLAQKEDGKYEFMFKDNGEWNNDIDNPTSFGLEMVDALTEQLDGNANRFIDNGTIYKIHFENQDKE